MKFPKTRRDRKQTYVGHGANGCRAMDGLASVERGGGADHASSCDGCNSQASGDSNERRHDDVWLCVCVCVIECSSGLGK